MECSWSKVKLNISVPSYPKTQRVMSKTEKERLRVIQEKCVSIISQLLREEDNKYCVDCDAKGEHQT